MHFLSREKVTEAADVSGMANPSTAPALNIFNALTEKIKSHAITRSFDTRKYIFLYIYIYIYIYTQVHLNKLECHEKVHFFSCKLFQKVKLSYILDSLHVK